jgi:glycine cleavage system regulatory protein
MSDLHRRMLTTVVITVFGADRPGLVEAVSSCASAHGGNWLESRMLHLGGHFAGIARLEVDEGRRAELTAALRTLGSAGLSVIVHEAGVAPALPAPASAAAAGTAVTIELVGHDRPGIVREIAGALARQGVNVEDLATERTSAPMSGEPMFTARAEVLLPAGLDVAVLRRELERIAADLMVDLTVREGA